MNNTQNNMGGYLYKIEICGFFPCFFRRDPEHIGFREFSSCALIFLEKFQRRGISIPLLPCSSGIQLCQVCFGK